MEELNRADAAPAKVRSTPAVDFRLALLPEKAAIDWNKVVFNMLTIRGIYGREMYETWYKMTALIQSGLDITPVITHRFAYTDFQKGFDLMRSGKSGKIVLTWS